MRTQVSADRRKTNAARYPQFTRGTHRAFSLIELLVATVLTLIIVLAVAQAFAVLSETVTTNRAVFEMSSQLRGVTLRLERDLQGLTLPIRPWPAAGAGVGYFEYYEGPVHDYSAGTSDSSFGDVDDILMFTAHSVDAPFTGRIDPNLNSSSSQISARTAEVAWWTRLEDRDGDGLWTAGELYILRRRAFLICPELNNDSGFLPDPSNTYVSTTYSGIQAILEDFQRRYDLSVRCAPDTTSGSLRWRLAANSLADLTRRESRFAHVPHWEKSFIAVSPPASDLMPPFPYLLNIDVKKTNGMAFGNLKDNYSRVFPFDGEDVVATNLLAFDVRVFDPNAAVRTDAAGVEALVPGDPGFGTSGVLPAGEGAFVDLNYVFHQGLSGITSDFSDGPQVLSQLRVSGLAPTDSDIPLTTYDTWSLDYERDGVDQDGPLNTATNWRDGIDQGTNGFDDDGSNGVDDAIERETSPPYPVPLRGVQIRFRMIDPSTRQVRQSTVVSDFTPE